MRGFNSEMLKQLLTALSHLISLSLNNIVLYTGVPAGEIIFWAKKKRKEKKDLLCPFVWCLVIVVGAGVAL